MGSSCSSGTSATTASRRQRSSLPQPQRASAQSFEFADVGFALQVAQTAPVDGGQQDQSVCDHEAIAAATDQPQQYQQRELQREAEPPARPAVTFGRVVEVSLSFHSTTSRHSTACTSPQTPRSQSFAEEERSPSSNAIDGASPGSDGSFDQDAFVQWQLRRSSLASVSPIDSTLQRRGSHPLSDSEDGADGAAAAAATALHACRTLAADAGTSVPSAARQRGCTHIDLRTGINDDGDAPTTMVVVVGDAAAPPPSRFKVKYARAVETPAKPALRACVVGPTPTSPQPQATARSSSNDRLIASQGSATLSPNPNSPTAATIDQHQQHLFISVVASDSSASKSSNFSLDSSEAINGEDLRALMQACSPGYRQLQLHGAHGHW